MSLTRACAFLGCSWLVALAACGGDGGSTDVEPTLRFADRTDTELLRLIDAAGGTDLFRATGMIDQFGDTFEIEPCPTITIAGSVATVTGGCARADGSRLEGTGAVDNPIGWDQLGSVLKILVPLTVHVALIEPLGIYVPSAILIVVLMTMFGSFAWWQRLLGGVLTMIVVFVVFELQFKVPLPKGPLENWLGY